MKLQNLTVIFIIIVLPVLLVLSYYMSLQINTINMQTAYDSKLLNSTKSAIQAYEINTVEWNPDYSQHPDSQRRDVMASIESFTTAFANGLGMSGTNKENVLTYVPAIAYTLYDGYYIYTPSEVYLTVIDENEVTVTLREILINNGLRGNNPNIRLNGGAGFHKEDEGKVLYQVADGYSADGVYTDESGQTYQFTFDASHAKTEYKHILKPFSSYSKTYYVGAGGAQGVDIDEKKDDIDLLQGDAVIVNYTLDNYVKVYVQRLKTVKEGYLTDKVQIGTDKSVNNIKHDGSLVKPEELSENIAYYVDSDPDNVKFYYNVPYVYEIGNKTKVYLDTANDVRFVLEGKRRVDLTLDTTEEKKHFKKVTVPFKSKGTYMEIYQDLVTKKWYGKNPNDELSPITIYDMSVADIAKYGIKSDIKYDYSGINYCVESFIFTSWVKKLNLVDFKVDGFDPLTKDELKDSAFVAEKREVIKQTLEANLSQAITSYSEHTTLEYVMPELSETDWDQILTNVSIVTFVQNMPIGLKYYNNYAIATSTLNAEYVDPDELYISDKAGGDTYYHKPYCKEIKGTNLIAYRNTDYVAKSFPNGTYDADGNELTDFYFRHTCSSSKAKQACYYCMIQRELKKENATNNAKIAYNTGLARERYVAKRIKLPPQASPSYFVHVHTSYNDGTEAIGAPWRYTLNGGEVHEEYGERTITPQVPKNPATYSIDGKLDATTIDSKSVGDNIGGGFYNSFTNPVVFDPNAEITGKNGSKVKRYIFEMLPAEYGIATSNSWATVTTQYDPAYGLTYSVTGNEIDCGGGYEIDEGYTGSTSASGHIDTKNFGGYVNVKLIYTKNYTETTDLKVFANIDDKDCITIGTDLCDATGLLRVVYKNGTKQYCTDVLNITAKNTKVFFKIPGDTSWCPTDWEVTVCNLKNEVIYKDASGTPQTKKVDTYTIKTEKGLTGLSYATNNQQNGKYAKTEGRYFLLINDVSLTSTFTPICTKGLKNNNLERRFRGVFRGDWLFDNSQNWIRAKTGTEANSKISNLKQATATNVFNLGLFGFIDGNAVLSHFEINTVAIVNTDADWQTGTVAGFVGENAKIEYVTVSYNKNKVQGKADVGGITGHNNGTIDNCSYEGQSVSGTVAKKYNCGVGGIAGYNYGDITNSTCNSPVSGTGECYNIGGIVGYNGSAAGKKVANNTFKGSSVSGGDNCLNIGGIVGLNGKIGPTGIISTTDTTVRDISSNKLEGTGTVKGGENCRNIGGVVGCNIYGKFSSNQCVKNVTAGKDSQCIGGIVGYNLHGDIQGCNYSNGNVKCLDSSGNAAAGQYIGGLAGYSKEATIKNNTCSSVSVTVGDSSQYIGGMIGCSSSDVTIMKNTCSSVPVTAGESSYYIGGIVGYSYKTTTFESNNHSGGAISTGKSSRRVGGIIGSSENTNIKSSSNSKASITSGDASIYIGGIVGSIKNADITSCNNSESAITAGNSTATISAGCIGGIAGRIDNGSISSSNNTSSPIKAGNSSTNKSTQYIGGIVGYCISDGSTARSITNSNNNSSVTAGDSSTAKNTQYVGGIAGYITSTNITNSSCSGSVTVGLAGWNIGGIAGQSINGKFERTNFSGSEVGTSSTSDEYKVKNIGGIIGYNNGTYLINSNCTATKIHTGDYSFNTGGIVGLAEGMTSKVIYCENSAEVTGNSNVGGIVGQSKDAWIHGCKNTGTIVGLGTNWGGMWKIEEWLDIDEHSAIDPTPWYNTGSEWATGNGGIVGKNNGSRAQVSESSNHASVTGSINTGGIAGINSGGIIKYCFNKGNISTTELNRIGGIVGASSNGVIIEGCYNIGNVTGVGVPLFNQQIWTVLYNGIGGIIGSIHDNNYEIDGLVLDRNQSTVRYCYNTGRVSYADNYSIINWGKALQEFHTNGLVGTCLESWEALIRGIPDTLAWFASLATRIFSEGQTTYNPTFYLSLNDNNYYLDNTSWRIFRDWGAVSSMGWRRVSLDRALDNSEMNTQLNSWASNTSIYKNYSGLGYNGRGVLFWEVNGHTDPDTIFTVTIQDANSLDYTARGTFVKSDGSSDGTSKTSSSGRLTVRVKYADNIIIVHRKYYGDEYVIVDADGTYHVQLQKTKYFTSESAYTTSSSGASWRKTGQLGNLSNTFHPALTDTASGDYSDTERDVLKISKKNSWGRVVARYSNDTAYNEGPRDKSNWRVTIYEYYVGTQHGSSELNVKIYNNSGTQIANRDLTFAADDHDYTTSIDINNDSVARVQLTFKATNGIDRRFWITSAYIETRN